MKKSNACDDEEEIEYANKDEDEYENEDEDDEDKIEDEDLAKEALAMNDEELGDLYDLKVSLPSKQTSEQSTHAAGLSNSKSKSSTLRISSIPTST